MTMAAEIKNRVGPAAANQAGSAGQLLGGTAWARATRDCKFMHIKKGRGVTIVTNLSMLQKKKIFYVFMILFDFKFKSFFFTSQTFPILIKIENICYFSGVKIDSKPVEAKSSGGCCQVLIKYFIFSFSQLLSVVLIYICFC